MPDGRLLIEFAEAAVRGDDDFDELRRTMVDRLGPDATGHAAATVSAFSGLVRVADGTGIPIDDGLAAVSVELRDELGLDSFAGVANSPHADDRSAAFSTVEALFDNRHGRS